MNWKEEKLKKGETFTTSEKGNSMIPFIKSGQNHILEPVMSIDSLQKGDIVFCKIGRRYFTHQVKQTCSERGVLIGNAKGRINGWTKKVFGKVIDILNN